MKIRVPSYYKKFKCIGSACEDTCCEGWDVVIDDQTYEIYQKLDGPFGDRLRSKMVVDKDGDHIFVLDGIRCPFLNNHNLCDIHADIGEQYLCYTCKQYPRYEEDFHDLREIGISLSCPEAARIILGNNNRTEFELIEHKQVDTKAYFDDKDLLDDFFQCRKTIINTLEMVDKPFAKRVAIVLKFVEELQDKIDFSEFDEISRIREKYEDNFYLERLLKELDSYKGHDVRMYSDVQAYFESYRNLEHISTNDPLGLNKILDTYLNGEIERVQYTRNHQSFNHHYKDHMNDFNKILIYFVYRYFMKSFFDYDMSSKIKLAMMSTVMIKELAVVRWIEMGSFTEADMVDISHEYSKDVEHLVENVETLERIFETEEVYAVDKIINTLINEF